MQTNDECWSNLIECYVQKYLSFLIISTTYQRLEWYNSSIKNTPRKYKLDFWRGLLFCIKKREIFYRDSSINEGSCVSRQRQKLSSTTCYAITYYLKTWFTFLKCCTWQIIENVRSPLTVFCQIFYHLNIWQVSFRSYLKHEHLMIKTKKKFYQICCDHIWRVLNFY